MLISSESNYRQIQLIIAVNLILVKGACNEMMGMIEEKKECWLKAGSHPVYDSLSGQGRHIEHSQHTKRKSVDQSGPRGRRIKAEI